MAIGFALPVIPAITCFLAKGQKGGLVKLFGSADYLVLFVVYFMLLCQLGHGLVTVRHNFRESYNMEYRGNGMVVAIFFLFWLVITPLA